MSTFVDGLPEPFTLEAFADQVSARLGDSSPGETVLKGILRPLHERLRAERER